MTYEDDELTPIWLQALCYVVLFPAFLIGCAGAAAAWLESWDERFTDWCLVRSSIWRPISRCGDGWLYIFAFLWMRQYGQRSKADHMAIAIFLAWCIGSMLKLAVRRKRQNPVRSGFLRRRSGMLRKIASWSFPSQHAAVAVAFAYALWPNPFAAVLALAICCSRVLIGAHYLGDVLAGIAVGLVAGRLA